MNYRYLAVVVLLAAVSALSYAADSSSSGEGTFVSNAISDVFDKVGKVTSGEKPLIESMNDYEMDASGKMIPKKRGDTGKRSPLEEKLGD